MFYSTHQEIVVYADGKLILQLDCCTRHMGKYSGWTWNLVRFSSNVSSLQVQFTLVIRKRQASRRTFYIDGGYNIYRWVMRRTMPAFLISMMVILIGLYISIYWIVSAAEAGSTEPYCIWVFFDPAGNMGRPMRRMWQRCS